MPTGVLDCVVKLYHVTNHCYHKISSNCRNVSKYNIDSAAMSSNTGHSVLPWMITLLYVVSIALFVMAAWHFQLVITTHKEQIQQLSERLALLEGQQNEEGTLKTTVSTVRPPSCCRAI